MKKVTFIFIMFFTFTVFAQKSTAHYKKVYNFDEYHQDWALVKTIAGTFGFINRDGKEIVPAIYDKIYEFEIQINGKKYAMIKNVANAYGFIDDTGKEIVQGIHWKKEEALQKLNNLIN